MKSKLILKTCLIVGSYALVACASSAAKQQGVGSGDAVDRRAQSGGAVDQSEGCAALASAPSDRGVIDPVSVRQSKVGRWVVADSGGRLVNLCKVLKDSGKKVAIFQFAGVTCDSCQKEAIEFARKIRASRYSGDIALVTIFTDFRAEFIEGDFQRYMATFAPTSLRLHDDEGKLWKAINKFPQNPDRAPIAALSLNGKDAFSNEEGKVLQMFDQAEILAADF